MLGPAQQAVVDPRDVATVAVEALLGDAHNGQRYDLTGPELLTFAEQAAILAEALNRPVTTADVDARAQLTSSGMPEEAVDAVAARIGWARAGGAAYVTDHVAHILGRPAGTFGTGGLRPPGGFQHNAVTAGSGQPLGCQAAPS